MRFLDTEPDQASDGTPDKGEKKEVKEKREITVSENQYHAMRRKLEKLELEKEERKLTEELKTKETEEKRLADEGRFDELQKLHADEVKGVEDKWQTKVKHMEIRAKLGRYFDDVFIDFGVKQIEDAEDLDVAVAELLENENYQRYRVDKQLPTPPGLPPAGTKPAHKDKTISDLRAQVHAGDRDAAREMERCIINGESV